MYPQACDTDPPKRAYEQSTLRNRHQVVAKMSYLYVIAPDQKEARVVRLCELFFARSTRSTREATVYHPPVRNSLVHLRSRQHTRQAGQGERLWSRHSPWHYPPSRFLTINTTLFACKENNLHTALPATLQTKHCVHAVTLSR